MNSLRTAVIGAGYLGKFHAEKYAKLTNSDLIAIVDKDFSLAKELAKKYKCLALEDYKQLIGQVDAVSIVTPTNTHFEIGLYCLQNGLHVLMEKPITTNTDEAQKLINLAKEKQLTLQVGFLERFNPTVNACIDKIKNPIFIESTRIMPFNPRNKDVNVVLDLMIHDIDLIQSLVQQPIDKIDSNGACVLTDKTDIANARISFTYGCVANVTASRVSMKSERKMRIFQHDAYFSLDFQNKQVIICRQGKGEILPGIPNIKRDVIKSKRQDALSDEIAAFITTIQNKTKPIVSGEDGKQALKTALEITEMVKSSKHYKAAKA